MPTHRLTTKTLRTAGVVLAAVAFIAAATGIAWLAAHWDMTVTSATLTQARDDPPALRRFITHMPKDGAERGDLIDEYIRAVRDNRLSYPRLKKMVRNSMTRSSLPDADKRRQMDRFDHAVKEFERSMAGRVGIVNGLILIAGSAVTGLE